MNVVIKLSLVMHTFKNNGQPMEIDSKMIVTWYGAIQKVCTPKNPYFPKTFAKQLLSNFKGLFHQFC